MYSFLSIATHSMLKAILSLGVNKPLVIQLVERDLSSSDETLADPGGGGPGGPGPPRPPDLEAPVIQFGGPVYNLRAKQ